MIMTTQQGQQMIVTQVPRQHHVIVNQHTGNGKQTKLIMFDFFCLPGKIVQFLKPKTIFNHIAGANVIQSNPQMSSTNAIINQVTSTPISSSSQPQIVSHMRGMVLFHYYMRIRINPAYD